MKGEFEYTVKTGSLLILSFGGSGHGLAVRLKGYIVESCFLKGRKANRGLRWSVQDYSVSDQRLVQAQMRVGWKIGQR